MVEARMPTLAMRGVSKTFPGVKALNDVQLEAWGGEVLALMGENGAGKSTLMKILSGAYQADAGGEIQIDGEPVAISDPIAAKRHGIAIIYQELSLAPNLTVAENIYLGDEIHKRGIVDRKAMDDGCRPVLERLGAPFGPETIGRHALDRRAAAGRDRPRAARQVEDPGAGRADHRPVLARDRAPVRAGPPAAQRGHRADLHQPPHGRGLRAVRPGLGAARRLLCRHARAATSSPPTALVKMMVGRDLSSFYKKEHDPHGSRGPVILEVKGADRRRPAGQALQLPAARGRGAGHRRAGRLRPDRARAADLRRRPEGRRRGAARRAGRSTSRGPRTRSIAASPT